MEKSSGKLHIGAVALRYHFRLIFWENRRYIRRPYFCAVREHLQQRFESGEHVFYYVLVEYAVAVVPVDLQTEAAVHSLTIEIDLRSLAYAFSVKTSYHGAGRVFLYYADRAGVDERHESGFASLASCYFAHDHNAGIKPVI